MTLVATGQGMEVRELAPTHCAAGHELRGQAVLVGWLGCTCAGGFGHRTWLCRQCGHTTYDPQHVDPSQGAGRVRGR